jgi:uncharacterized membrane protein YfcA
MRVSWLQAMKWLILVLAAVAAGAVNAVAGGGTLITFPSLIAFGVPSVTANATSTVALVPGSFGGFWGFRDAALADKRTLAWMALPSLVGGALGAWLLLYVGNAIFARMVPWLIYAATLLYVFQGPLRRLIDRDGSGKPRRWALVTTQLVIATYGGFFGAGIGILMLAAIGLFSDGDIRRANGLKNFSAMAINTVAAITFLAGRHVDIALAGAMTAGAIAGGYGAARWSRHLRPSWLRIIVITIGLGMGTYTLLK